MCLDVLLVVSKLRCHLQALAYLRQFKESYDVFKKFRCSASFLEQVLAIYDLGGKSPVSVESTQDAGRLAGMFRQLKKVKQTEKLAQVLPTSHPSNQLKASLQEQLDTLGRLKYPFVDLVSQIYYRVSSGAFGGDVVGLTDFVVVSRSIKTKIFRLLDEFFLQREVFAAHVSKVLLFVGSEELTILHDFASEDRAFGHQVVSVGRLREKAAQILLDDISMQNQLNIPTQDNKQQRILEFTNLVNKVLAKFADQLFQPRLLSKTQDLLRILGFHETLMEVFKVKYDEKRHSMMLNKTLKFFEYFMFRHPANMAVMIPYCRVFVDLIESRLLTARVIASLFQFITSSSVRQKILKAVFEKIFAIAGNADVFLLPRLKQGSLKYDPKDKSREKLCEYFRVVRTLMLEDGKPCSHIQQLFLENLIFCFPLCKNLLPSQLELLATPEVKADLSATAKDSDSLLGLLREFYCLVNLSVMNNSNALLMVASLLDQISIKTVVLSEDIHPLLRVQLLRLYTEAYIFALASTPSKRFDREKIATKSVDALGFINDHMLVKFQYSLPFLLDFGMLAFRQKGSCFATLSSSS